MNKSVLVIDTPEKCISCIYVGIFHYFCRINCRDIKDVSTKPEWCPLKPLPEKMKVTGIYNYVYLEAEGKPSRYRLGWNDCIDAITGGGDSDD